MFIRAFLTLKVMKFLKRVKAFKWFAAELETLLMCILKFSLSSVSVPSNSPDRAAFYTFFLFSFIWTTSLVWYCFLFLIKIIWNLTALTVILFSLNHMIIFKDSDNKIWRRSANFFGKSRQCVIICKIECWGILGNVN